MKKFTLNEKTAHEIQNLVKNVDSINNEISIYCELIKELFLLNSCKN